MAIAVSKFLGFKIIVRNAEDAVSSTLFAENKFQSLIILFLKIITYNFSDKIISNSIGSGNSLKKILLKKKKYFLFIILISKKLIINQGREDINIYYL